MTSDSLKWWRFAFAVAFVISIYHASASPVKSDDPCQNKVLMYKCGKDQESKLPTFEGFKDLKVDIKVGISALCSTIDFLCLIKSQEDLKMSKKVETEDVCKSLSSSNGLAVDCEKQEKNEECAKAKTFTKMIGKLEHCKSICHVNSEAESVCKGLLQVQEIVSSSTEGPEESETEKGEAESKPSSVKKAEVKKSGKIFIL